MKTLLRFFTWSILLFLTSFLLGGKQTHAKNIRILAFGDSLTAGYRLKPQESYPKQLEIILREKGVQVDVLNAGVSGDTSAEALRRVNWSLKQGPFDWVLLCIGANDGLRQLPVKQIEENLIKLIATFKKSGARVFLLGNRMPSNYTGNYRKDFEALYKRVAHKEKTPFYPFVLKDVAMKDELNLEDRIHPNKAGYKRIAQNVAGVLIPLLSVSKP